MKKNIKILLCLCMLFIAAGTASAKSPFTCGINPHDSLLFDGENAVRTETFYSKSDEECVYRVTYVKGTATGKIRKMQIIDVCGIRKDTIYEYQNGAIEKYSVIKGGEMVKTGPESTAKIELSDGSVIVLGPNTDYTLPVNVCDVIRKSSLNIGSVWTKVKKMIGGGKFEVSTERMTAGVRGTEFSVEIIEENGIKYDVTKVYEGSVDISLKNIDTESYEKKSEELDKLTEDFEAGKITMEEYTKKALEMTQSIKNETKNLKLSQIVEAGYMLKSDGKVLGEPVQFNTSEDTWFNINE
jgi:hypothetical protein